MIDPPELPNNNNVLIDPSYHALLLNNKYSCYEDLKYTKIRCMSISININCYKNHIYSQIKRGILWLEIDKQINKKEIIVPILIQILKSETP